MEKQCLYEGTLSLFVLRETIEKESHVEQFLKNLQKSDRNKLFPKLEKWAKHGSFPPNRELFTYEEDNIYAIKSYQIRLYGFFYLNKREFIITDGVIKKKNRANKQILENAKQKRERFIKEFKNE